MQRFAALYDAIDASTSTLSKVRAMREYFTREPAADCAWAVYVLAGGTPRRVIPTSRLRALACEAAGISQALFDECYQMVGDLAETIAHLVPDRSARTNQEATDAPSGVPASDSLADWMQQALLPLRGLDEATQRERVLAHWQALDASGRFLYVKLIGGGLRVGVARGLVIRALAAAFGLDEKLVAQRMMGFTSLSRTPSAEDFAALIAPTVPTAQNAGGSPYPFFLAQTLKENPEALGPVQDWQLEWKYDGIRAQAVVRGGGVFLWSRGEELVNETFPDVVAALAALPEATVIDGELLVWHDEAPAPFAALQKRLGRKRVSKGLVSQYRAVLLAYDCLEIEGRDLRAEPLHLRRRYLEALSESHPGALRLAPILTVATWTEAAALRAAARAQRTEGLMLKRKDSAYGVGRTGNAWWKWKLDPYAVDAVLTYAQRGHGRRAGLYTDYTFGVWTRRPRDAEECARALSMPPAQAAAQGLPTLVTFATAYSGLTDDEIKAVDKLINETMLDDFGPVRAVRPTLVMELGFEGIQASSRHKSGVAVRFPRILRLRADKPLHEADTLDSLQALLR